MYYRKCMVLNVRFFHICSKSNEVIFCDSSQRGIRGRKLIYVDKYPRIQATEMRSATRRGAKPMSRKFRIN